MNTLSIKRILSLLFFANQLVYASRTQNYVDLIQNSLEINSPNHDTAQRAKISYEEELQKNIGSTLSRRTRETAIYNGRVRNSNKRERCDMDCHETRGLSDIDPENMSFVTLNVKERSQRITNLQLNRDRLSIDNMINNYKWHEAVEQKIQDLPVENRRSKREIFNYDTRFNIIKTRQERYPFTTVVKLSTGCSGHIVDSNHIITAAHCIHDGRSYVKGAKKLRVGRPRVGKVNGRALKNPNRYFKWKPVHRVHFPENWKKTGKNGETEIEFDYAILSLRRPIGSFKLNPRIRKNKIMKLGVAPTKASLTENRLYFSNFDYEQPTTMRFRFCKINEESTELYYNYCDASRGSSGAGIYSKVPLVDSTSGAIPGDIDFERRITSIFSGHRYVKDEMNNSRDYNVAVKITPMKLTQICLWILKDADRTEKCKTPEIALYGRA